MTRICTAVYLDVPPTEVYQLVTTAAAWPQWHPSSLAVHGNVDHSLGLGEVAIEDYRVAGREGRVVWTVLERDAPYHWVIEGSLVGREGGGRIAYHLTPHGGGTIFEREFTYQLPSLFYKAMDQLLFRRQIAAESAAALRALKQLIEGSEHGAIAASNDYYFLNRWHLPFEIERVWAGIAEIAEYPEWWGTVYDEVRALNDLPPGQVGGKAKVRAHGRLPYHLTFVSEVTEVQVPTLLVIEAKGDLTGRGTWRLEPADGSTTVTFEWIVRADKPVVRHLSWLLKPLFEWNHRWTMKQGEVALKNRLTTPPTQRTGVALSR